MRNAHTKSARAKLLVSEHVARFPARVPCSRALYFPTRLPLFFSLAALMLHALSRRSPPILQSLGIQTCLEATAAGTFFAVWWRISHVSEKNLYDKYYTNLRAEQAALADE